MKQEFRIGVSYAPKWWYWPLVRVYAYSMFVPVFCGLPQRHVDACNDRFFRWCSDHAFRFDLAQD